MEKYELQRLRELPIEAVAERLGLEVRKHKSLCPFHDDHHASLSFKVSKNTFRCFVCGAGGGPIDLVMRYLNKDFLEACRWLGGEVDGALVQTTPPTRAPFLTQEGKMFDPGRYGRFFERPWLSDEARRFLLEERRLDERVVRWCRLTSWRDRHGTDWLQVPYYDREGRLIGIQNRNLGAATPDVPRFRFPSGSQCSVYNLPVLQRLQPGDALWITEGCSDCWAMLSAGHKAIAIPSATLLKPGDALRLQSLASALRLSLHMYPDRDEPGERLFLQLRRLLPSLVHHQLPPGCKDYSDYYLSAIKPADAFRGSC